MFINPLMSKIDHFATILNPEILNITIFYAIFLKYQNYEHNGFAIFNHPVLISQTYGSYLISQTSGSYLISQAPGSYLISQTSGSYIISQTSGSYLIS